MAYRNFTIEPLLGLNEDRNPHSLRTGELTKARNATRRSMNLVGTRPGCVSRPVADEYENPLTGDPAIQGAVEYRKDFDEGRALIVIADNPGGTVTNPDSKIWFGDDNRLDDTSPPTITSGADNIWTFGLHSNLLWAAGGASGDDIWTWDGDTAAPSAPVVRALTDKASGNRLRPKFLKSWRGYMLVNGLRGGTSNTNNPALSRYQSFGEDPADDVSWEDGNSLGFFSRRVGADAYGGAFATGFGTYQDNNGDFLLALSNDQIVSYVLDPTGAGDFIRSDVISNGCVHQRAFVDLGPDAGDAIFMSRHGIHSLRQSQQHGRRESAFLSRKIQQTFQLLNPSRLDLTCAAYDRQNGRIVFVMSTGSSTQHDILMALDVRHADSLNAQDALWYGPWVISGGVSINHLLYARDQNDIFRLFAFTTDGRALTFEEDVFHDLADSAYEVVIRTNDESYGSIALEKSVGDVMIHVQPGGDHTIEMSTEFNYGIRSVSQTLSQPAIFQPTLPVTLPFTIGMGEISSDVKVYATGRGRTVASKLRTNQADSPFFIGRIERQIEGAGEDAGAENAQTAV